MDPVRLPAPSGSPNPPPFWSVSLAELFAMTETGGDGLSPEEAARRLARDGPNTIDMPHTHRLLHVLVAQFTVRSC